MKKHSDYRLIKEYPGSYKIGYILKALNGYEAGKYWINNNWFNPEEYPEFWEPVEKDYEILSYRGKSSKNILGVLDPFVLTSSIESNSKNLEIYSVKRLSDGEIFTIGDKIDGFGVTTSISLFRIEDNILKVGLREVGVVLLGVCKHKKEPLLTTEDGVEIFHEGVPVVIYSKLTYGQLYSGLYFKSLHDQFSYTKILFFAKKENALNWVEENESKYSKKDLLAAITYSRGCFDWLLSEECLSRWLNSPYCIKK